MMSDTRVVARAIVIKAGIAHIQKTGRGCRYEYAKHDIGERTCKLPPIAQEVHHHDLPIPGVDKAKKGSLHDHRNARVAEAFRRGRENVSRDFPPIRLLEEIRGELADALHGECATALKSHGGEQFTEWG